MTPGSRDSATAGRPASSAEASSRESSRAADGTRERAAPRGQVLGIPCRALIVSADFGVQIGAERVAQALARGLQRAGWPAPDSCPLTGAGELRELLAAESFDSRMRESRAVVVAERSLRERTLELSATFEIATRTRQAGVPTYAVTADQEIDEFDARMLDLQVVIRAASIQGLAAAGRRLGELL